MEFEVISARRLFLALSIGILLLNALIPEIETAPAAAPGEIETNSGMEDTRKWSSGVGLWGKRSEPDVVDPQFLAFVQNRGRYLHKRPEDSWNKLNSLWGKRSNWQTGTGLWGKRSYKEVPTAMLFRI